MAAVARTRTTTEPEAIPTEFAERILATVTSLAERVLALEEANTELLRGLRGIAGSGVLTRSPAAVAIAQDVVERKGAANGH